MNLDVNMEPDGQTPDAKASEPLKVGPPKGKKKAVKKKEGDNSSDTGSTTAATDEPQVASEPSTKPNWRDKFVVRPPTPPWVDSEAWARAMNTPDSPENT